MTWNPRTALSGRSHDGDFAAGDASSSFDPSRTGDPIVPGHGGPAIGFGGTRLGGFSSEPRRRPIGFAPPEDERGEPHYRTELSFKRHTAPVASATPPAGDGHDEPSPWQTPADPDLHSVMSSVEGEEPTVPNYEHEVDELVSEPVAAEAEPQLGAEHDLEPESDEKQPFYKREITFRRKRGSACTGRLRARHRAGGRRCSGTCGRDRCAGGA